MRVPLEWLREYVDFDASAGELAERLTFSGMEVEGIETVGSRYPGIVVGEILSVGPHPGADHLRVCRVTDGRSVLEVVCGAPNVAAGQKAVLARAGTTLPGGLAIRATSIRGAQSEGMLCAEDELGISDDHGGIVVLSADVSAGTPFEEVIGPAEQVLVLEITWNRPDCLCLIGVAREVAALYGSTLRKPEVRLPEGGEGVETMARVRIEDPAGCPRYTAHVLTDVGSGRGPLWMQRRLRQCGVRPISVVVDITNYVMLECGQPLHAFDCSLLADNRIIVRRAGEGESMATLDGVARRLSPEILVIADAKRPVAVAGIMGGAGSEICATTRTVLLESACFDPSRIHIGSKALGLSTESSHRFERGVDPGGAEWAGRRAAALMVELAGARPARGVIDEFPAPLPERSVVCRYRRVDDVLGVAIAPGEVRGKLQSLGFEVADDKPGGCTVKVPSFRRDIEIEADLIEEVARLHGLERIPEAVPAASIAPDADDSPTRAVLACRNAMVGLGLTEIANYSFVSAGLLDRFGGDAGNERVVLPNPVSADHEVLRNALVPQMVQSLGNNVAHQNTDLRLFEMGRVFLKGKDARIREEERVVIGLLGRVGRAPLDRARPVAREEMFLWVKGLVEELLSALKVRDVRLESGTYPALERGWSMGLAVDGGPIGFLGLLDPAIAREWRIVEPLALAELSRQALVEHVFDIPAAAGISAFPSVSRDLAVIVDETVTNRQILAAIADVQPAELTHVSLFDIFKGEGIGSGKRSLAYRFVYRSMERSLTDEDVNGYQDGIRNALRRRFDVEIREG